MATFGKIIADARRKARISQKELAAQVKKADGEPISPQYLNDIEHDRRNPPGESLIEQFARILSLPRDSLMIAAGVLPADFRKLAAEKIAEDKSDEVTKAVKAFRRQIQRKRQ